MNQTEAWETVLRAAQLAAASFNGHLKGSKKPHTMSVPGVGGVGWQTVFIKPNSIEFFGEGAGEMHNLIAALKKVSPRVQRMRARLDFSRARRAGKLNRPSWATP